MRKTENNLFCGTNGSYHWSTTYYHDDNIYTMNDFIEKHLPPEAEIVFEDGSYCEVIIDDKKYALNAKGDGDSYHHVVEWVLLNE